MNVLIIDDDKAAIKELTKMLADYAEVSMAGSATTAKEGIEMIAKKKPDLIFLDVELPDISGITLIDKIKKVPDVKCKIVVYSSHDQYILNAFRKKVFDYLLKPIDRKNLDTIMDRYYSELNSKENGEQIDETPEADLRRRNSKFMLYMNSTDFVLARPEDIGLFKYNHIRKIWEVVVAGKSNTIPLKHSISRDMILSLSPKFIQVHQSFIINLDYLIEVVDNKCHFYPPFDNIDYAYVGRIFRKRLTDTFFSL
jgi:two-component system LytT family response regulator